MSIEGKMTFWEILDEFKAIEIPVIQRDYAQGRRSKEITDIRDNFLESIKNSLLNGTLLDLNFIYGSTNNNVFIPIDGQQRLTTLYLLHLYLLLSTEKDLSKKSYRRIRNFTYKTRLSSNDFCERMTKREIAVREGKKLVEVKSISKEIMNNSWFSTAWINDPTIKSMLTMLDSLHQTFKNEDLEKIIEILMDEDGCPIYFYFLELDRYSLEDSIYIKLNARGKALTDFENFKAKLTKFMTDELNNDVKNYIAKLDGQWSDVFWTYHDPMSYLYDDKTMNFIVAFVINDYAAHMTQTGRDAVRNEIRTITGYSHLEFINRFQKMTENLDGHKIVNTFIRMFDLFNILSEGGDVKIFAPANKYINERQLFKWIIDGKEAEKGENKASISYTTRICAYAYYGYLLEYKGNIDEDELINWFRVISTLSRETNYNGADDYVRAIKGVRKMLPHSKDILKYLSSLQDIKGYGFDIDCFEEECIKAVLIQKDNEWKEHILSIESNAYFNGQIGFLLEFAGITDEYKNGNIRNWDNTKDFEYKKKFKMYSEYMNAIFGEFMFEKSKATYIGINRSFANSIRRAMLCYGDYTLTKGYVNKSFLVDFDRDISWKRFLRIQRSDAEYKKKRRYLFNLLNDNLFDVDDIGASCDRICNRDVGDIDLSDWRKYFIQIPTIMDHLFDYKYYQPKELFIRRENKTIFLMGSTRLYGYNDEYYSYALYCMLKGDVAYKLRYIQAKGWEDIPEHIIIKILKSGNVWRIKYNRSNMYFEVYEMQSNQYRKFVDVDEVVSFLNSQK